uniref:Uncharacterized protein n=1 Tax=Anguilla anguilla TaxID=7936 RepID=A0A0E9RX59_ANGAN
MFPYEIALLSSVVVVSPRQTLKCVISLACGRARAQCRWLLTE